ncbi:hypothetical protein OH76DRAFT_1092221 [Lentinus brumalis]|uniref:Uncharacterized protein n=1 Tax=Lentinus brumalis TaxID=2498619 RepID=A0A371CWD6_9APHY|nr:hypothetical protein OH76DRAFT_1092221 [Polyporus brumalis]
MIGQIPASKSYVLRICESHLEAATLVLLLVSLDQTHVALDGTSVFCVAVQPAKSGTRASGPFHLRRCAVHMYPFMERHLHAWSYPRQLIATSSPFDHSRSSTDAYVPPICISDPARPRTRRNCSRQQLP